MKLYERQVGQRFTFIGKYRGKVFVVIGKTNYTILYKDVATEEIRTTGSNRKTFRMEVELAPEEGVTRVLTKDEISLLNEVLALAIKISAEDGEPEDRRNRINKLYLKINGLPERRPQNQG